jgi:hypothetical protein
VIYYLGARASKNLSPGRKATLSVHNPERCLECARCAIAGGGDGQPGLRWQIDDDGTFKENKEVPLLELFSQTRR